MANSVGIDIGGTFTDFVRFEDGRVTVHKRPTTSQDPAQGFLQGLEELGVGTDAPLVHATTVATNILLERRGAKTALVTTVGFRDVIEIGRQTRPHLYDLFVDRPAPLVARELRWEAAERVDTGGHVLVPLERAEVGRLVEEILSSGAEAVAVCLLFSFLNPAHELEIASELRRRGLFASASCEVLPEFREYERTSTTAINAYLTPKLWQYLSHLERALTGRKLSIMQSNGGLAGADAVRRKAIGMVLSGPAAGVVGAKFTAAQAGLGRFISFDMGGTSTDVSLCDGEIKTTTETAIGGLPLRLPLIDVHTVGAGGGSIARLDPGGALLVGPESAGADPGPVCYGFGKDLTVTDANLALGRLIPRHFLDGTFPLRPKRVEGRLRRLAGELGSDPESAALGIVAVAVAAMERAVRNISVDRGHDPRDFVLVAFGGAGPMHACELAEGLGIGRILVPRHPGVLSALGLLVADLVKTRGRTVMLRDSRTSAEELSELFSPLEEAVTEELLDEGVAIGDVTLERGLDTRYVGQSYELTVSPPTLDPADVARAFDALHLRTHGYARPEEEREIVTLRVTGRALTPKPAFVAQTERRGADADFAQEGTAEVVFGTRVRTAVYLRERLSPGMEFAGPALVVQFDTTVVVPPGWRARVDGFRNLILEHSAEVKSGRRSGRA